MQKERRTMSCALFISLQKSYAFYKHIILYAFFIKISKKKKSYAILFLCVRRIATHFLLHSYNISFLQSCQALTYNFKTKFILPIYFTII